ncbi:MAG: EamA family transporter [Steroidobacteraceae bacterium]
MSAAHQRRMLVLCLATVYLVWGSSYIATRVGVLNLPPLLFAGLRFILGGVLLTAVAFWRGFRPAQLKGQWRHLLVLSFIGVAISNGLQSWALQWVPSHTSALLNASCALWIVVFGLFGARAHHPGARAVTGLVVGFAGTALLMWPAAGDAAADSLLVPQLVTLLACVVWSLGTIYMRNHSIDLDLFALIGLQMLLGGTWMALTGLALGELPLWHWSMAGALALAYLVIFSCCFAYTAYGWLARHATPAQVGTYSYVNPAIAAVAGYVLLDERLSPEQIVGAVVILAGVLMINWPARSSAI